MIRTQRKLLMVGFLAALLIAVSHGFLLVLFLDRYQTSILGMLSRAPATPPATSSISLDYDYFSNCCGPCESRSRNCGEQPSASRIRLFCGRASTRKPFPITLYVKAADPDQIVTLQLPEGMTLAEGQQAERRVPRPGEHGYALVSWMVQVSKAGQYSVRVEAPGIGRAEEPVRVIERGMI